jgi:hypothetical protein
MDGLALHKVGHWKDHLATNPWSCANAPPGEMVKVNEENRIIAKEILNLIFQPPKKIPTAPPLCPMICRFHYAP